MSRITILDPNEHSAEPLKNFGYGSYIKNLETQEIYLTAAMDFSGAHIIVNLRTGKAYPYAAFSDKHKFVYVLRPLQIDP